MSLQFVNHAYELRFTTVLLIWYVFVFGVIFHIDNFLIELPFSRFESFSCLLSDTPFLFSTRLQFSLINSPQSRPRCPIVAVITVRLSALVTFLFGVRSPFRPVGPVTPISVMLFLCR